MESIPFVPGIQILRKSRRHVLFKWSPRDIITPLHPTPSYWANTRWPQQQLSKPPSVLLDNSFETSSISSMTLGVQVSAVTSILIGEPNQLSFTRPSNFHFKFRVYLSPCSQLLEIRGYIDSVLLYNQISPSLPTTVV